MSWWVWRRGLRRIKSGLCPECYSSPPLPDCPVCSLTKGRYSYRLNELDRLIWLRRWKSLRAERNGTA